MVRPPLRGVSAGRIAGARPGNGRYDVGRAGYYGAPGWGTAGLVTGSVIGAAAASTYPAYQTPTSSTVGGYCATTVRTCALSNAAPVGTGCSCRTQGGRARGTVVGGLPLLRECFRRSGFPPRHRLVRAGDRPGCPGL
jgi:hypothetical protein